MAGLRKEPLIFQWGVSSYFGWGVYGLNLIRHLADDPFFTPIPACPVARETITLNESGWQSVGPILTLAEQFQAALRLSAGQNITLPYPLLQGLGHNLTPGGGTAHGVTLQSERMVGVVFFENRLFDASARERAQRYRKIIAGSSWNETVLREMGIDHVVKVLQGIDRSLFHPAPPTQTRFPGFTIFSGGKIEPRKGQDLVLLAFRAFHQRHPDAVLVTAWHSPWQHFGEINEFGDRIAPPPWRDGRVDVTSWATANGIPAEAVIDLGAVPNPAMPAILREMKVALFANRCEGGTNLMAMEAMACGVPTILSANTGHLDLIQPGTCLPLSRQRRILHPATEGWGESDLEEMVESLEQLYQNQTLAHRLSSGGAALMGDFDWRDRICHLRDELLAAFVF